MAIMDDAGVWIIGTVLGILHMFLVRYIYMRVPEPYMDEIFHIDQTRRYCAFDFSWNAKITTPPALYILTVPFLCGKERYINSALVPFAFVGSWRFRAVFQQSGKKLTALQILFLPVLFQSSTLYYTDLLSLTSLLWAISLKPGLRSTLCFVVAVLTRQTNIVWAAAYGFIYLILLLNKSKSLSFTIFLSSILRFWSLLLLAFIFILFFFYNNKSVVLGDRNAHQPVAHFMQIYYFLIFLCFNSIFHFIFSKSTYHIIFNMYKAPIKLLLSCAITFVCIHYFTFEHEYLLADNRHFTFYVWRRWFRRHPFCRYISLIPYLVALFLFQSSSKHIHKLVTIVYCIATCAVLVPAHLLEPRYFIVPYVLWRLTLPEKRLAVLLLELLYEFVVNCAVFYLFLEKPFEWVNEPGVKQRFMW